MTIEETPLGFSIRSHDVLVFFGKAAAYGDELYSAFPQFQFRRLRQVHGDRVVESSSSAEIPEADGHWTHEKKTGLIVSTADCGPIMIAHPRSGRVASLHAGWRGVASHIFPQTISLFSKMGLPPEELLVWIGPHIQMNSFEVGDEVKNLLLSSTKDGFQDPLLWQDLGGGKSLVDLSALIKAQARECDIRPDQLFSLHLDTKTDLRFHSFRRDGSQSGRQWSFIVRE